MASANKLVLIFVVSFWLITSFSMASCSRACFGGGGDTSIGTKAQNFGKGGNTGEAAILGARPVPSAPNPFHHHGFRIRTSPPSAPLSEP